MIQLHIHNRKREFIRMAIHLQIAPAAGYTGGMDRENKTAHLLLRVRPSFKAKVEAVANALGKNNTEVLEEAFLTYSATKRVREALAREESS